MRNTPATLAVVLALLLLACSSPELREDRQVLLDRIQVIEGQLEGARLEDPRVPGLRAELERLQGQLEENRQAQEQYRTQQAQEWRAVGGRTAESVLGGLAALFPAAAPILAGLGAIAGRLGRGA